ncbi:invasin domain 3-containing protein, partial [Yoonia sp.]|uniref:invasin domain 3-containing protein n=1 Tax=Yoonia sp. TaxID=2212373 RepID=UPI00391B9561
DTINVTVDGTAIANSPLSSEIAVASPVGAIITASPSSLPADGSSTSVLTIILLDGQGNQLIAGGDTIVLTASVGSLGPVTDNGNGSYTSVFTAGNSAGAATVALTLDGTLTDSNVVISIFLDATEIESAFSEVTSAFIERRMDRILASEPLSYRLDRRREVVGHAYSVEVLRSGNGNQGHILLSGGAASALSGFAEVGKTESEPRTMLNFAGQTTFENGNFHLWAEGTFSTYTDATGSLDQRNGSFGIFHLGGDVLINENLSFGMMASFDRARETIEEYSRVTGKGWMVGPYLAAELAPGLYFTARVAYGRSDNSAEIDIFSNEAPWSGDFTTERFLARGTVYGETSVGNVQITPAIDIAAIREKQSDYRVSNGFDSLEIAGSTTDLGRLALSSEFSITTDTSDGVTKFYATPTLAWDFNRNFSAIGNEELHGAIEVGLSNKSDDGWQGDVALRMDGIGEAGFEGYSLRIGFDYKH